MKNRLDQNPSDAPLDVRAMVQLHQAGWSIGDIVVLSEDGRPVWIISGSNGENLIRVEGGSKDEAWGRAVESVRTLGILGRSIGDQLEGGE